MTRMFLVALLLLCNSRLAAQSCGDLEVADAWVREPPPAADVAAAFLDLYNRATQPVDIVAVTSDCCADASVHRTAVDHGQAHMVHLPAITVPASGRLRLAPGGLHIMLAHPRRAIVAGNQVVIELRCASGDAVRVAATVMAR